MKGHFMLKESDYQELEKKIGYTFQNRALLKQAVTHSSFANEQKINRQKHYERLEFLGDAVLELVSSDFLFQTHPEMPEGQLTKLRASMVCEPALAYCAKDLTLDSYIQLGKGEEATGGRYRDSIVSDVMEAVIGAIYLDGGMEPARTYIHRFILSDLENKQLFLDSKTNLQEYMQQNLKIKIKRKLLHRVGIQHAAVFRRADAADGEITAEAKVKRRAVIVTKRNKEIIAGFSALKIFVRRKAAQLYISGGGAKEAYVRILGKAVCLAAIGHGDGAYIFANDSFCKPFAGKCIRQSRRYA